MTASTLSHLPLMAGSALASSLGRAGLWTLNRYMRAPLASTGLLVLVTMTAMAASNALYQQPGRHPAPFFAPAPDVPVPVAQPAAAPIPMPAPVKQAIATPAVTSETTASVPALVSAPVIPDAPVGNIDAFNVQKRLTELGLFNGKVDGFYGPMTAAAIRAFEERNGLTPTGAMTPAIVEAILKSDASGRAPVAAIAAPVPAPAPLQHAAVAAPEPVAAPVVMQASAAQQPLVQQDQVVARVAELSPIDNAVDTVGDAAAQTIDSIVAAVGGASTRPAAPAATPVPALPMAPVATQPMPEPVAAVEAAVTQEAAVAAPATNINPANNAQLVSQIQQGLASLGFYHGSIDGHPGDSTARAIREFENFHSYKVTGQINPDLVGLLRDAGASI